MIVKVKSREMTAFSKSKGEKIKAVRDKRKTDSGHKPGWRPAQSEDFCGTQTLPLEKQTPFYLGNSILCYVPWIFFFFLSFHY